MPALRNCRGASALFRYATAWTEFPWASSLTEDLRLDSLPWLGGDNKPGKAEVLRGAQVAAVTSNLAEVTGALESTQ
jgi:hypothetical protein